MSKIKSDGHLRLPTPYKLLRVSGVDFPQRLDNAQSPTQSALDGHSASGDNYSQPQDLLLLDHCDFLMGEADISLRRAHIINACRNDKSMEKKVVQSLHKLGITWLNVREEFDLQHKSNLILLRAADHIKFDDYAIFAITGSEPTLDFLIKMLTDANAEWDILAGKYIGQYTTRIWHTPLLKDVDFEIVLLHPYYFISPNQRTLYFNRAGLTPASGEVFVAGNVLMTNADVPFPPFRHQSSRNEHDTPNIWFFVLNAAWKFVHHTSTYGNAGLSERAIVLIEKTLQLVALIYHQPTISKPSEKLSLSTMVGDDQQSHPVSNTTVNTLNPETPSNFLINNEVQGGDDGMQDGGSDSDDSTGVGLTEKEADEVLRQLEDPALSGMDRFRLHSLLFFPKPYQTPHSFGGLPEPPSVFDLATTAA